MIELDQQEWQELKQFVDRWARDNVPDEVNYNSRMTYWRSAHRAGVVTTAQLAFAKARYGQLWDYVGD